MPSTRYFLVSQTRNVQVRALDEMEAAEIAHRVFEDRPQPEKFKKYAKSITPIRVSKLVIEEAV